MDDDIENIKIVFIGSSAAGRTCLIKRYIDNCFCSNILTTMGAIKSSKKLSINKKKFTLDIWDFPGQ